MLANAWQRLLVAHLNVEVDQLMTKRREFVAEAEHVDAGLVSGPNVRIVLLLLSLVQHVASRILQHHVNIVLATGDDLSAIGNSDG